MCDQCEKLQEKIVHYRELLKRGFDPLTEDRIRETIAELERRKAGLH